MSPLQSSGGAVHSLASRQLGHWSEATAPQQTSATKLVQWIETHFLLVGRMKGWRVSKSGWIGVGFLAVATTAIGVVIAQYLPMIDAGTGYKAKLLCSGVFVSKRREADVLAEDLRVDGFETLRFFSSSIDRKARSTTASLLGFRRRVALFREGLGCTLAIDATERDIRAEASPAEVREVSDLSPMELWPEGSRVDLDAYSSEVDRSKLKSAMDFAFREPSPDLLQRTRAVVVVHRGRVVAERYASGFDRTTALLGWSMSKSALNALIGIAIANPEVSSELQKPLGLSQTDLLPAWRNDERSSISLDNLMKMSSGLAFDEDYTNYEGDVLRMLFGTGNKGAFAAAKSAVAAPGTRWAYASGTSNIVSYVLRSRFKDKADYLALPRRHLFNPLGMRTAVIEPDASGTFTASSFMYASARDWARLGLLFLRDGVWFGHRILPEGWVARSLTPARGSADALYGSHFWLKLPGSPHLGEPPMPTDSFYMLGHDGQVVAMVPSRELVIVRLGLSRKHQSWRPERVLGAIAAAFPATSPKQ